MTNTQRFADKLIKDQFPLDIDGEANWSQHSENIWESYVQLPTLKSNQIIVPSYSSLETTEKYQFSFHGEKSLDLYPVPSTKDFKPVTEIDQVSGHIDCWHSKVAIESSQIRLRIEQKEIPSKYLITLSTRDLVSKTFNQRIDKPSRTSSPEALSQMTADKNIRHRICSPTATSMALSLNNEFTRWSEIISECHDPATNAYGSWPLAIRCASARGFIGSVETNHDWSNASAMLAEGQPIVCSIRFKTNELKSAPLDHTHGHLVCVYGIEGNKVLTLDPAGDTKTSVNKYYDLEEFSKAWLEQRGAAYFFYQIN